MLYTESSSCASGGWLLCSFIWCTTATENDTMAQYGTQKVSVPDRDAGVRNCRVKLQHTKWLYLDVLRPPSDLGDLFLVFPEV